MKCRPIYGLLPLVLLAPWLGCKSAPGPTLGGTPPATAAPASTPAAGPAENQASAATAQPPANTTAATAAQGSPNDPQRRSADLQQIMSELKSLGTLDPQAQTQLIQDLQQTDPALWPLVVQAFRTSLAYRQRAKTTASTPANAVTGATPSGDKTTGGTGQQASSATSPASSATATPAATAATTPQAAVSTIATIASSPPSATADGAKPAGDVKQVSHETVVKDEDKAADLLVRSIAALEKEVQDAPQSAAAAKAQLQLRMLYLAVGRRTHALRAVPGLSGAEQDFWADEVFGLATYLDSERMADAGRRATEATLHLNKAAGRLAELGSLTVRNLAFCTEVSSFGTYTAFAQNEFKPGQHVLLYAEVENFKSEESPKGFHTALRSNYHIFDSQGRRVTDQELPLTEEHCQNRRRDFFVRYFLSIPARAYDGKYNLQLTIEDTLGRKIGQSSIDFTVKEK